MKISEHQQGSPEWFSERLGIPTASNFGKILTSTGKPSTQAKDYMLQLAGEWLIGEQDEPYMNAAMERGILLEPMARQFYEYVEGVTVEEVGLCLNDDGDMGASPDGLIGEDGGIEIKCPKLSVHVETLVKKKVPAKYIPQIQGCMYITGRKWWDYVSYHDKARPIIIRVERNEEWIKLLGAALDGFIVKLDKMKEAIK